MSANSAEAAAEALAAAVQQDGGAPAPGVAGPGSAPATPEAHVPPVANQPDAAAPQVDAGTPDESDSLLRSADIDLSGLTPDQRAWLDAREREMQGVMTKRTQEAAEIKALYEDLDPAKAREALAFYEGVRTDPNY